MHRNNGVGVKGRTVKIKKKGKGLRASMNADQQSEERARERLMLDEPPVKLLILCEVGILSAYRELLSARVILSQTHLFIFDKYECLLLLLIRSKYVNHRFISLNAGV